MLQADQVLIRVVLTSPEIAISKSFNERVLKHPAFYSKLCLLAIDELHLVSEWREFRPDYFNLNVLRARLPDGLPVLGASATLDPHVLSLVKQRCGFSADTATIKTPLDRPEIYLQVTSTSMPIKGMVDLQHVLPAQASHPREILKTIIYMDSVEAIKLACNLMVVWMKQLGYPQESNTWVRPFFSDMALRDKQQIQVDFSLPAGQCPCPILIATDAYGIGVDNRDVKRVIQWLVPPSLSKLVQRMGRAMRCGNEQAYFMLLYPPWCEGPRADPNVSISGKMNHPEEEEDELEELELAVGPGKGLKDADRRLKLASGLWELINTRPNKCVRDVILGFFGDDEYQTEGYLKPVPCCSVCNVEFELSTAPHDQLLKKREQDSLRRPWFISKLKEWREQKAAVELHDHYGRFYSTLVMPDSILSSLATWAEYIVDENTMRRWVDPGWEGLSRYSGEIVEILNRGQAMRPDIGEIFEEWKRSTDIKRGRAEAPANQEIADFMERRDRWLADQGIKAAAKRTGRGSKKRVEGGNAKTPRKQRNAPTPRAQSPGIGANESKDCEVSQRSKGNNVPVTPLPQQETKTPRWRTRRRQVDVQDVELDIMRNLTPSRPPLMPTAFRAVRKLPARFRD